MSTSRKSVMVSEPGPLPTVYYRRLFPTPEVRRNIGGGVVHRVADQCVAYDFYVPPQPEVSATGSLTIQGDRWRRHPTVTYHVDHPRLARVYLPPDEWVNAIAIFDLQGDLLHARFDAATPPYWYANACYQTDLFLDLLYNHRTGNYLVLDEDEFAEAAEKGFLPQAWQSAARDLVRRLETLGDQDGLWSLLNAWCPAPVQQNSGIRTRESVRGVPWPI